MDVTAFRAEARQLLNAETRPRLLKRMFGWEPLRSELASKTAAARKEQKADELKREKALAQQLVERLMVRYTPKAKEGWGSDAIEYAAGEEIKQSYPYLPYITKGFVVRQVALTLKRKHGLKF